MEGAVDIRYLHWKEREMNLFITICLANVLVGTVGPLPYDEDECHSRIAEKWEEINPNVTTTRGLTYKDVEMNCEWRTERPSLGGECGR